MGNSNGMDALDLGTVLLSRLEHFGVPRDAELLIAVSGGVDSMCLLHAAHQAGCNVAAAHVNHCLRGEDSDLDEQLVRSVCIENGITLHVTRADTLSLAEQTKRGIEETARAIRYDFFAELIEEHGYAAVLTAHNKNDQAETVLMRLLRGAGPRGLAGIPESRPIANARVLRPWLHVERRDIVAYSQQHEVPFREDASNRSMTYTRNKIRHSVFPAMEQPGLRAIDAFAALAQPMRAIGEWIEEEAKAALQTVADQCDVPVSLDLQEFERLREPVQHAVLEAMISRAAGISVTLYRADYQRVLQFLHSAPSGMQFNARLMLEKDEGRLIFRRITQAEAYEYELEIGEAVATPFGAIRATLEKEFMASTEGVVGFDLSQITLPLEVRNWRDGDRLQPFGMQGGSKKVSDVLNEAGIGKYDNKRSYPVVTCVMDGAQRVIWVPGIRRGAEAPILATTETVLRLIFEP